MSRVSSFSICTSACLGAIDTRNLDSQSGGVQMPRLYARRTSASFQQQSIERVVSLVDNGSPFHSIIQQIGNRLCAARDRVLESNMSRISFNGEAVGLELSALVKRLELLVTCELAEPRLAFQLVNCARLLDRLREFNEDLDRMSCMLPAVTASNWQLRWKFECDIVEERWQSIIMPSDHQQLYAAFTHKQDQLVALAVLKSAIASRETSTSQSADERHDLWVILFRKLLRFAEVKVPSLPSWFLSPAELDFEEKPWLGSTTVQFYYARRYGDGSACTVVVKQFLDPPAFDQMASLIRDVEIWSSIFHPNLIRMLGGCHVTAPPFVVFEHSELGCLDDFLAQSVDHNRMMWRLLHQVAGAIQYLHQAHELVHGDLCCSQVLVNRDFQVKLTNWFGVFQRHGCAPCSSDNNQSHNAPKAVRWTAPEVLRGDRATFAADIFSLGMTILEASTGDIPWGTLADESIQSRVLSAGLPPRAPTLSDHIWSLIEAMCDHNTINRPPISTIIDELQLLADEERERDLASTFVFPERRLPDPPNSPVSSKRHDVQQSATQLSSLAEIPRVKVVLKQQWLGVKVNSIGSEVVLSKFLRSSDGAVGEVEDSGQTQLGDIIVAVNCMDVRGMNRHDIGALIQTLPRPIELVFQRDPNLLAPSFQFSGLNRTTPSVKKSGGIRIPGSLADVVGSENDRFSVEIWFSINDEKDAIRGGVIFGAQVGLWESAPYSPMNRQFAIVDTNGCLFCSVFDVNDAVVSSPAIANELIPSRWYHLVMTFEKRKQRIYLNGELRHSSSGLLNREDWHHLTHVTVGSGCVGGNCRELPSPGFSGWYTLNGLVFDTKVWCGRALGELDVQQLYRGAVDCVESPTLALKHVVAGMSRHEHPNASKMLVNASQPHHVVAQVY